jgi:hypothetical protein
MAGALLLLLARLVGLPALIGLLLLLAGLLSAALLLIALARLLVAWVMIAHMKSLSECWIGHATDCMWVPIASFAHSFFSVPFDKFFDISEKDATT